MNPEQFIIMGMEQALDPRRRLQQGLCDHVGQQVNNLYLKHKIQFKNLYPVAFDCTEEDKLIIEQQKTLLECVRVFKQISMRWKYFSGNWNYPVPGRKAVFHEPKQAAYEEYAAAFRGIEIENSYTGTYGLLRLDLANFVLGELGVHEYRGANFTAEDLEPFSFPEGFKL